MRDIYWKELSGFKKFLFVLGWIGVLNAFFWIVTVIVYYTKIKNKKVDKKYLYFFNPHTYKVVYVFGCIWFALLILALLLLFIFAGFLGGYIGSMGPVNY